MMTCIWLGMERSEAEADALNRVNRSLVNQLDRIPVILYQEHQIAGECMFHVK